MTKVEMIAAVAEKAGVSKSEAEKVIGAYLATVAKELKKGAKVMIPGFGGFSVRKRAARNGINPKTKQVIKIAACKTVGFKPAKALKEIL